MVVSNRIIPFEDRQSSWPLLSVGVFVVAIHCLFVAWAWFSHAAPRELSRPTAKRLMVQTVALSPPRPQPAKSVVAIAEEKVPLPEQAKEIIEESVKETLQEVPPPEEIKPQPQVMPVEALPPNPDLKPQEAAKPKPDVKKDVPAPKKETAKKAAPVPKKAKASPTALPKKAEPVKAKEAVKKPKAQNQNAQPKAPTAKPKAKEQPSSADLAAIEKQKKIEAEQKIQKEQQQKLLLQAKETIAKIDRTRDKFSSNPGTESAMISLPGGVSSLQIDGITDKSLPKIGDREASYRSELASRLKLLLKLPEYGDVNIKLTLDRSGKVLSVIIVSAESAANRKYIEKTVPGLTFPGFGSNFGGAAQYTFSITLSNDF